MFPGAGMTKKIFKPLSDILQWKSKNNFEEPEEIEVFSNDNTQFKERALKDETELADRYESLLKSVANAEEKLEKLKANKVKLSEERFNEINETLTVFLNKANPVLLKLRERLDNSIAVKNVQEDSTDIKTDTQNNHKPVQDNESLQSTKNTILEKVNKKIAKEVDIVCGTKLNMSIEGIAIPMMSFFVGLAKNEYLLITYPQPYSTIRHKSLDGNKITVQYPHKGNVFIFATKVIEKISKPIRVFVVEYPDKILSKGLRSESRISCKVPAEIFFRGAWKKAVIIDLNVNGCRIEAVYEKFEKNYIARLNDSLKIKVFFPGTTTPVTISGTIKNTKKKNFILSYGIKFIDISYDIQDVIKNYTSSIQVASNSIAEAKGNV